MRRMHFPYDGAHAAYAYPHARAAAGMHFPHMGRPCNICISPCMRAAADMHSPYTLGAHSILHRYAGRIAGGRAARERADFAAVALSGATAGSRARK